MRILVLSTFDIWPAQDGGQSRYYNLWTNFSREHEIKILVYEFRNTTAERRYRLASNVEVIVPAASLNDARHFHHMMERTSLWLHDILCFADYTFSPEFISRMREQVAACDVLVASHPYLAPMAYSLASAEVMKIYESFNVEYDIKRRYFEHSLDKPEVAGLLRSVRMVESFAAKWSDHVTAVSDSDKARMEELYDIPREKVSVVPNGANITLDYPLSASERCELRAVLDAGDDLIGVFLGSAYLPNVRSYFKTREMLERSGFSGKVILIGTIDRADRASWSSVGFQEVWAGFVEEPTKVALLASADFALQLIFDGAGTNLKVFDYINAGVPILANSFGRRGVDAADWCWAVESSSDIECALQSIRSDPWERQRRVKIAREIGLSRFDWKAIASRFEADIDSGFGANGGTE